MRAEVDTHIDEMLQRKVIEPADGPWSSGIVLVKKKDGSTRFCDVKTQLCMVFFTLTHNHTDLQNIFYFFFLYNPFFSFHATRISFII